MVASYDGRSLCSRNIKRTVTRKSDVSLAGGGYELLTRSCCPNPGSITPMLGPSFFETIDPPSDVNSGPGSPGQAEHSMVSPHRRDESQKCHVDPVGGFSWGTSCLCAPCDHLLSNRGVEVVPSSQVAGPTRRHSGMLSQRVGLFTLADDRVYRRAPHHFQTQRSAHPQTYVDREDRKQ